MSQGQSDVDFRKSADDGEAGPDAGEVTEEVQERSIAFDLIMMISSSGVLDVQVMPDDRETADAGHRPVWGLNAAGERE